MEANDLGEEEGLGDFAKATKVALIDCDTVVYAAASVCEYADDMLDRDMYTDVEWQEIIAHPNWDAKEHCIWKVDTEKALELCERRIQAIIEATNCKDAELYFTSGRNFRFTVDPMYKANRKNTRYPPGMYSLKEQLLKKYKGEICTLIEADDAVVYLKRTQPKKYVLCAVDKDVYKAVAGEHYNYYYSAKYKIEPKWVTTTKEAAELFPYIQTLMGDSTDNIRGCPGIGPKKAEKALDGIEDSAGRWDAVVRLFKAKGLSAKDAMRDMRLVNMHQVTLDDSGWTYTPWSQPI